MEGTATLADLGWDDRVAARLADLLVGDAIPGRIVRVDLGSCLLTTAVGDHRALARQTPAVGDWAAVRVAGEATIAGIAERWSELARRDPAGLTQVLAANIDLVFVAAPADRLSVSRVERETAMAWDSGARPVVLLTKADLAGDEAAADLRDRVIGVDVITVSTVSGEGVDNVRTLLQPARTGVLLGPSGAGKSTLTNLLLGREELATQPVRAGDHRGRHTTSARELFVLPSGGVLIDTPGLRSLSLAEDHGGVAAAFPEIEALAAECRFADCHHTTEPGCAVAAAEAAGTLDPARAANYRKLRRELEFDAADLRKRARRSKTISKAVRRFYRDRGW